MCPVGSTTLVKWSGRGRINSLFRSDIVLGDIDQFPIDRKVSGNNKYTPRFNIRIRARRNWAATRYAAARRYDVVGEYTEKLP